MMKQYLVRSMFAACCACVLAATEAHGESDAKGSESVDKTRSAEDPRINRSVARVGEERFLLYFDEKNGTVMVERQRKRVVLQRIASRFNPNLVGGEHLIRFLPDHLQPYKQKGYLLYTTTIRSSGGNGTGYCGSGFELYLKALDVRSAVPRSAARFLIGSCLSNIVLAGTDESRDLTGMGVVNGRLRLDFTYYPNSANGAVAVVSDDLSRLKFTTKNSP